MLIVLLLIVSFITRLALLFYPSMVWWDTAMYIGIGKTIYTHGALGLWENFRPLLWPVILGGFWKIGINPSVAGGVIEVVCGTAIVYLVYRIGERIYPRAGTYAAALLSFTGIFFASTVIAITDIPSAFLGLLAVQFAIEEDYVLSGLMVGLAFSMRFPQALVGICIAVAIVIVHRSHYKKSFIQLLKLALGFSIIAIPYLCINFALYHNALLPIIQANEVFAASMGQSTALFYYFGGLFIENPFIVVFGLAAVIYSFYYFRKSWANRALVFTLSCFIILAAYYSSQSHKELRYSIAFLPFFAILAGYGLAMIGRKFSYKVYTATIIGLSVLIIVWGIFLTRGMWQKYQAVNPLNSYYSFFADKDNATVITSSPQIIATNNVKITEIFDTWQSTADALSRQANNVDYVAINSCELFCDSTISADSCTQAKNTSATILSSLHTVFASSTPGCNLTIYSAQK